MRFNNVNLAQTASSMWGLYSHNEELGGDFAQAHFPEDPNGNVYRGVRPDGGQGYANFSGTNYFRDIYLKMNNGSADDFSDLFELIQVLNNTPDARYTAEVSRVLDVDMAMLYFAVNAIADNNETSLSNGSGDDFALYRGNKDRRIKLMSYDVDSLFGFQNSSATASIWRAINSPAGTTTINRFLTWPDFAPKYYATLKRLCETTFSSDQFNPLVDQYLGSWIDASRIIQLKGYMTNRIVSIMSQIPQRLTAVSPLAAQNGFPRSTVASTSLTGVGNVIRTHAVRVNGVSATWTAWQGTWSANNLTLNPGLNRLLVEALDEMGRVFESTTVDVWYDTGTTTPITSSITADATWTASGGPYLVSGEIYVQGGATLTIAPGTTVYFNAGARLSVGGRLLANGTASQRIRFTRPPAAAATDSWNGLNFQETGVDVSRLSYVDIDYTGAGTPDKAIYVFESTLLADHLTFSGTTHGLIELENGSLHVRDSVFPNIIGKEHIHGRVLPANGFLIIENNLFGSTTGLNDIIDFTGGQRPGAIMQVISNVFTAAADDVLDLDGTDAHIEGNVFMNVRRANGSTVDTSSAISGGKDGTLTSRITIVRNLFYNCDHAILAKEGNYYEIVNNTMLQMNESAINFDEPGRRGEGVTPGLGAYVAGNIIWNTSTNFENVYVNHPTFGTTQITFTNNLTSASDWASNQVGNIRVNPMLNSYGPFTSAEEARAGFALRAGSPAVATGPNGLDRGGLVAGGASITGEPPPATAQNHARLTVGGPGMTHYRYRVNNSAWSAQEFSVADPLVLTNLASGSYGVAVIGKNSAGVWQAETNATLSQTWTVGGIPARVQLSEILARNASAVSVAGKYPDLIELFNPGTDMVSLQGMSLTDDPSKPRKYVFREGLKINAGQYLTLVADNGDSITDIYVRFRLDDSGDALYLYDQNTNLIDSVVFGLQLPDYSLSRAENGTWALSRPTFGTANQVVGVGDPGRLKINEWLASAERLFVSDFVELFNPDSVPVDISGCFLTDNVIGNPTRNPLPPCSYMAPNGHLALYADGAPELGADHLNFKLGYDLGGIGLMTPALELIDEVMYAVQFRDVSQGRSPDGSPNLMFFDRPTPGAPNQAQTVVITPLLSTLVPFNQTWKYQISGTDLGTAWSATNYVDASWQTGAGIFYFSSNNTTPALPVGTTITFTRPVPQNTFYFRTTFNFSGDPATTTLALSHYIDDGCVVYVNGVEYFRFNLGAGTNVIYSTRATSASGDGVITGPVSLSVTNLRQGVNHLAVEVHQTSANSSDMAFGLALDAQRFVTNFLSVPVMISEVLARNQTHTNANGKPIDWVELFNPSTNVVDLSGMSITDETGLPRKWVFPSGATIVPGGYYVVDFDDSSPYSPVNAGYEISGDGGALYLFHRPDEGGGLLDSITYGLQAGDLSVGKVSGVWRLCQPTRSGANQPVALGSPGLLRINEWMPAPDSGDDWFELHNPGSFPVEISGLYLTDNLNDPYKNRIPALSFIGSGPNGYALFQADSAPSKGANHVNFKLSNVAEAIALFGANTVVPQVIDYIIYTVTSLGISQGRLPDGSTNMVTFSQTASPGDPNYWMLSTIVINEVLTHTDSPLEDAIELRNLTSGDISIGGWYLSNSRRDLKRYLIPAGTILPANGYLTFYEYQFNSSAGGGTPFTLNAAQGDQVFLSAADGMGNVIGYRAQAEFGPAANGISIGYFETSTGSDLAAMSRRTFGQDAPASLAQFRMGRGAPNSYPQVGPLVVSEIMYHPPDIGTNDDTLHEFIELHNVSTSAVPLYDPAHPTNSWRLRDAVTYVFPPGFTMAPQEYVLVVSFDPAVNLVELADFKERYGVPANVVILGPFEGKLDNNGEPVELVRPDAPQMPPHPDAGLVPELKVDKVKYHDSAPWPVLADGNTNGIGLSLQRSGLTNYGNDAVNWVAAEPSAGRPNSPAVLAAPVVVTQPQSIGVLAGSNVTFQVAVTGAAPLGYFWKFNGAILPGETNSTLVVGNAQSRNSGRYSVVAFNPAAANTSSEAQLVVSTPPQIADQPQDQMVVAGRDASFVVTAGGSALSYQWRFNGQPLLFGTNSLLVLTNVQTVQEGLYDVLVTNLLGVVYSRTAALLVITPPMLVSNPHPVDVLIGSNAHFAVGVDGRGLSYQWFFNGGALPDQNSATLDILDVQAGDAGPYQVIVSNLAGSVTSLVATLSVIVPPLVDLAVSPGVVTEGGASSPSVSFTRSAGSTGNTQPLTVYLSIAGSAVSGVDYAALPAFVTIPAGVSSTNLLVPLLNDATPEGDETLTISLLEAVSYRPGATAMARITILDDDNQRPVITFMTPTNSQFFAFTPTNILVSASASDTDGSIALVQFYDDTNFIGQAVSVPYQVLLTNATYGTNWLYAQARDNLGAVVNATPIAIVVNHRPEVRIVNPLPNQTFASTLAVAVDASASDLDGSITTVWLYDQTNLMAVFLSPPYSTTLTNLGAGSHQLLVVAQDDHGMISTSAPVNITVNLPGFFDNFEPDYNRNLWTFGDTAAGAVEASDYGGYVSPSHSLWFGGNGTRSAATTNLNTLQGGLLSFYIRLAYGTYLSTWESTDSGQGVVLEYSINGGTSWTQIQAYDYGFAAGDWSYQEMAIPTIAQTTNSIFRWRQVGHDGTGCDHWAIDDVQIVVGPVPPRIVVAPADQSILVGAAVSFSVTASGSAPLTYQWRFNGSNILGATSSAYSITSAASNHIGVYSVVVSNAVGSATSRDASLNLVTELTLGVALDADNLVWATSGNGLWIPQTTNTCNGIAAQSGVIGHNQNSLLSTVVSGPGTLSFWWRVSSESCCDYLEFAIDNVVQASIAGDQKWSQRSYRIETGNKTISWNYRKDGSVVTGSDRAWLDLVSFVPDGPTPPTISQQPTNAIVLLGGSAIFNVGVNGTMPFSYQWLRNGTNAVGISASTLTINNVASNHLGVYTVVITNAYGSVTSAPVSLTIGSPLQLLQAPVSQTVMSGANVTFEVLVSGSQPIQYVWYYNGSELTGYTSNKLVFDSVTLYYTGTFAVTVINPVSTLSITNIQLTVLSPPFINAQPRNREFLKGMPAVMEITVDGSQPYRIQWRKNKINQLSGNNPTYNIASAVTNHSGNFDVVITNAYGSITSSVARLTVIEPDTNSFGIASLTTNAPTVVDSYAVVNYNYYDGIATSGKRVFINGYNGAAGFNVTDLGDPSMVPSTTSAYRYGLVSDLRSQKAYVFANNSTMIGSSGGTVNSLIELDPQTGALTTNVIRFSQSFYADYSAGFFSGSRQVVVHSQGTVYSIALPSGKVSTIGTMATYLPYNYDSSWYYSWGIAENWGTNTYLTFVRDQQSIIRMRVSDSDTTVVGTYNNLGYMGNIGVSMTRGRWYFRHRYNSQFANFTETLGSASASFVYLMAPDDPVQIVEPPANTKVTAGGNTTLRVQAVGGAPLTYQWYKDGNLMPGYVGSQLNLYNCRLSAAGLYQVVVANSVSAVTSTVGRLTIDYGIGSYVTMPLMPMTNVWRYNTNVIYNGTNSPNWVAPLFNDSAWPSGPALLYNEDNAAVSPRLTPLLLGRTTYYFRTSFVVNTNLSDATLEFNTMVDDGAIIYLNGKEMGRIRFTTGTAANYGNYANASAPGSGGDATLETWLWSSANLLVGTNVLAVEVHQNSSSSTDICWGMSLNARIPVYNQAPNITNQPVSVRLPVGANATFQVDASGTAPFSYQWQMNGENIVGAQYRTLVVTNVNRANIGYYMVTVRNSFDVAQSIPAVLALDLPALFAPPVRSSDQALEFQFQLNPGAVYSLESSTNLAIWTEVMRWTNASSVMSFTDDAIYQNGQRFLRVREIR
jgi:hypothetical protein